jgi:hypothetical protein
MKEAIAESAAPESSSSCPAWWVRWWPYLVVIAVAVLASSLHVAQYKELSPIDETRHVDYLAQLVDDGYIVKQGDKIGDVAMRLEACRGIDLPGWAPPPCNTKRFDPAAFRDDGFNNAINNPPAYYLVTGAVAKVATTLGISNNLLDPARVFGGFWLAAGLALALYAGELLGLRRVPLVSAAVLFALAPDPLFMASIVNPDAASVFAGAVVFVAALLWERGRLRVGWLAGAAAIAASFKMTNLIGVGIVVAWLLIQAYAVWRREATETGRSARSYVIACAVLVGAAVAVTLLWMAIASSRATVDALRLQSNLQFYHPAFPADSLLIRRNLFSLFPPLGTLRAPELQRRVIHDATVVTAWLAIAAILAAALRFSIRDRISTLGFSTAAVLVAAGPGFIVSTWLVNRVIFQPSPRYAMSAIPILIVLTAAMVRGRVATICIGVFAALVALTMLIVLAFG